MSETINNKIPFVPENTIDPAAGLNLSLNIVDALTQVMVVSLLQTTPPVGVEGERHIVGVGATGDWSGQDNKLARYLDGLWHFYDASLVVYNAQVWTFDGSVWVSDSGSVAVANHVADSDPHPQYLTEVEGDVNYEPKRFDNLSATTDPTVTDDSSAGYEVLSKWLNTTTGEIWLCTDNTIGAANWQLGTLTVDQLGSAALANLGTAPTEVPTNADLGPAAYVDTTNFATAAQGIIADDTNILLWQGV